MRKFTLAYPLIWFPLLVIVFVSCGKVIDPVVPAFKSASINSTNDTLTVKLNGSVYSNADATGIITADKIKVLSPGLDMTWSVFHELGSLEFKVILNITSPILGTEKIEVRPADGNSIFTADGEPMFATASVVSGVLNKELGLIGKWYSTGENLSAKLKDEYKADSVCVEFTQEKTYEMKIFISGNETDEPDTLLSGTYKQIRTGKNLIWGIEMTQTVPFESQFSGIQYFDDETDLLWLEVVRTDSGIDTPPTLEAGFGSSNQGVSGNDFIQKYIKI
ncbi:MAG: hypothetical protein LWX70_04750 [Sphingobacteriia bacterium]|nr:hypothetical protein [Sphingobacteriia bacterium]